MNRSTATLAASLLRATRSAMLEASSSSASSTTASAATGATTTFSRGFASMANTSSATSSASSLHASRSIAAFSRRALANATGHSFASSASSSAKAVVSVRRQSVALRQTLRSFACSAAKSSSPSSRSSIAATTSTTTTTTKRRFLSTSPLQTNKTAALALLGPEAGIASGITLQSSRSLAKWLGFCAAWTFSMVVLGGVTRLTRSGLSMTSWSFTGEKPPMTREGWELEFEKYKQHPEYRLVNRSMTLEEFKSIYWMEWAHRMWGRALGLAFVVPGFYFAFVRKTIVNPALIKRLSILLAAGGCQGLVGWWMVRSGLVEPTEQSGLKEPRVAPTRLAAHLASATAIYCGLVYTSLQLAFPLPLTTTHARNAPAIEALRKARRVAHPLAGVVALTALSGAFVAGLDAGRAYNTFPKMNGEWVPEEYPGLSGAFNDTTAAQLHHRVLAVTSLASSFAAWQVAKSSALPRAAALALAALPAAASLQASLGVATLLAYVPPGLGSAHQAGALGLLTLCLGLIFATRRPPRVLAVATKRMMSSGGGGGGGVAAAGAATAAAAATGA